MVYFNQDKGKAIQQTKGRLVIMKCYRVYVENECVGTFFNLGQAINHQALFENARVEIEEY